MKGPNEPITVLEPSVEFDVFVPKFGAKFVSVYAKGKPIPLNLYIQTN